MEGQLQHYGVLGMRWGVRRDRSSSGSYKRAQAKAVKKDRLKAASLKGRSTMSTEELVQRIQRLQLEKQLRTLTESEVAPGRAAVKSVLETSGKQTATMILTRLGTKYGGAAADNLIKEALKYGARKSTERYVHSKVVG